MRILGFTPESSFLFALAIFLASCSSPVFSQESLSAPAYQIMLNAGKIYRDELGSIYLIASNNEILKYSPGFEFEFKYKNHRFGRVTSLDTSNPFKLMVFYTDYQMVIMLDNALTETGRYDLNEYGFNDINAVGLSNDNHIWVYDPVDFRLKKISDKGTILVESASLISERLESIRPFWLFEANNEVFLLDRKTGMHIFDNFGQYDRSVPEFAATDRLQYVKHQKFLFLKENGLYLYSLAFNSSFQIETGKMPIRDLRDFVYMDQTLFILDNTGVFLVNINFR